MGIFISYRRSSASTTTYRLVDDLRRAFGPEHIFLDVESIEPGIAFAQAIQNSLQKSSVALIMIDPQWATIPDKQGNPRLHDPHDWVRQEVRAALASGARVIPVLIESAHMPEDHVLPDDIKALSQLQAFTLLPSQTHWAFDVKRLIDNIRAIDPKLKSIVTTPPRNNEINSHYSYKVISGFVLYIITILLLSVEQEMDSDTLLGAIFFLLVAGMLFAFGFLDVRNSLVRGKKGAITGMVLCALGIVGHSINYNKKLDEEQARSLTTSSQNPVSTDNSAQIDSSGNNKNNNTPELTRAENQANADNAEISDLTSAETAADDNQPALPAFSGLWIGQDGGKLQMMQRDAEVTFSEFNAFGVQVGQGAGSITNQQLNFNYYNPVLGINAAGTAIMRGSSTLHVMLALPGQRFDYIFHRQ